MRAVILTLSVLGTLLFGSAFALSFVEPILIERAARELVRIEVERRVGDKVDVLSNSRIAGMAQRALDKTDEEVERTKEAMRIELPRKVAKVVADMLDVDCECRKRLVEYAQKAASERLSSLVDVRGRLVTLIESAYSSATASLMREFRIFTGSNAAAFALLAAVTLLRRRATLQLALPAVILAGAVVVTASLYLFNQNWLHTVVYGQYVGFAYSLYLAGVALLLADVLLNRARVSTRLINAAFEAVGSAASIAPC